MTDSSSPRLVSFHSTGWRDYQLVDSGDGRKLERFGPYTLIRPESLATWPCTLPRQIWDEAHAEFFASERGERGRWAFRRPVESPWVMHYKNLRFQVRITDSRHLGVFPEHAAQWDWIVQQIRRAGRPIRVLTLFSYTGLATLAAAEAGAQVTHVDASRSAVAAARQNQALSGLADRPVRWIVEDAFKFVQREARRGVRYDAIVMDPPRFGRGPKGEVWEFFQHFPPLCAACRAILSDAPLFILLTAYAKRASTPELRRLIAGMVEGFGGDLVAGQLITRPRGGGRTLPHSLTVRWSAGQG
ncbi:MAG: class I SAM-dependent methyltransferase [Anaerolineae bacterium]|nr:class I SAM-dependent methyltransferase [Anaerolineae bacterium]